jgi:hypothetical protein
MNLSKNNKNVLRKSVLLLLMTAVPALASGGPQDTKKTSAPAPKPSAPAKPAAKSSAPPPAQHPAGPAPKQGTGVPGKDGLGIGKGGPGTGNGGSAIGKGGPVANAHLREVPIKNGTARLGPHGEIRVIDKNGMHIERNLQGGRTTLNERPDGTRVVTTGKQGGYVQHPYFNRAGRPYVDLAGHHYYSRTYYDHGVYRTGVYRGYDYRGRTYYGYYPAYYYRPAFYAWGYNPWPGPVYWGLGAWGWGGAPWYGYYGFTPYLSYAGPAFWLTDYLLAANLQAAYAAQAGGYDSAGDQIQPKPRAVYQVHCGGQAVESFSADKYFSGGYVYATSDGIATADVPDAPPDEVYQSERVGNSAYHFPDLTPRDQYIVRLHFAEIAWNSEAVGNRIFNVVINSKEVLHHFDILAETRAKDRAIVKTFTVNANDDGRISIVFESVRDLPTVSAIEILQQPQASDAVGTRWIEEESGFPSTWTRRGTSDVFDAIYPTIRVTTVNTVTVSGSKVYITRTSGSNGDLCSYEGTMSPDGETITGAYRCSNGGSALWKATVIRDSTPPQAGGATPTDANQVTLTPEVKEAIADEVKAQLQAEEAAAGQSGQGASSGGQQAQSNKKEEVPPALDPARTTFVVDTDLAVVADGQECALTGGDVLTRISTDPDGDQRVNTLVSSSKKKDCAAGKLVAVKVDDLQEMQNHFREKLDEGIKEMAAKQGTGGMPKAPDTSSVASDVPTPDPDKSAAKTLQDQQATADQTEAEAKREMASAASAGRQQ